MSYADTLAWLKKRGEAGLLRDLLAAGIVRPLGCCSCHSSNPTAKPACRPSQSKSEKNSGPVACGRCERCENRTAVDYSGTPWQAGKNRLNLLTTLTLLIEWLEGNTNKKVAATRNVSSPTTTSLWRKFRKPLIWGEMNKPLLDDKKIIVDITWGPKRRSVRYGAPQRPRPLESNTFQVALAFTTDAVGHRVLERGSLRVQEVASKDATYNCKVLRTIASPTCETTTDQGGEWARLPLHYAKPKRSATPLSGQTQMGSPPTWGKPITGF